MPIPLLTPDVSRRDVYVDVTCKDIQHAQSSVYGAGDLSKGEGVPLVSCSEYFRTRVLARLISNYATCGGRRFLRLGRRPKQEITFLIIVRDMGMTRRFPPLSLRTFRR